MLRTRAVTNMFRTRNKKGWLLLWAVGALCCFSSYDGRAQETFRMMFYNVENLFDCRHDSLKEDCEFLPDGEKRWTPARYWRKLNALSKVIAAAGEHRLPDVIGLCEVENDSVLSDLTRRSALRTLGYRYLMTHSPDVRGIDVALLYQPGSFRLLAMREVEVPSREAGFRPTRNVLYAKGRILAGDTLHLLVGHLPSRLGTTRTSRAHRRLAVCTVRHLLDSIYASEAAPRIVVMGDFNAGADDALFRDVLSVSRKKGVFSKTDLLYVPALSDSLPAEVGGTYRYRGLWETIDHIWVSPVLMDSARSFHTADGMRSVAAFPFLCEPDETYGGVRPFRTYQGPLYKGGYSDHFPVILDFVWRFPDD